MQSYFWIWFYSDVDYNVVYVTVQAGINAYRKSNGFARQKLIDLQLNNETLKSIP